MEDDVGSDLSGHLKRVIVALMTARRPENTGVNLDKARQDARELLEGGVKQWGEVFVSNASSLRSFDC